jgi:hypothetical protein
VPLVLKVLANRLIVAVKPMKALLHTQLNALVNLAVLKTGVTFLVLVAALILLAALLLNPYPTLAKLLPVL